MSIQLGALSYGLRQMLRSGGGESVRIISRTTLSGSNPAPNPPVAESLVVNGTTIAGASSIGFRASILTGRVIAGDKFTLAGDPLTYVISAQVISPTTVDTLSAVPFSPALGQTAPDGTAVTLIPSAAVTVLGLVTQFPPTAMMPGTAILETDRRLRVLAADLGNLVPNVGALVVLSDGTQYGIIALKPVRNNGATYAYFLHLRQ